MSIPRNERDVSVSYPCEQERNNALFVMRPPGLSTHVYNNQQLHKRMCEGEQLHSNDDTTPITESYYKTQTKRTQPSTYDRINHMPPGYNQYLHRDDRAHAKSRGLRVNQEESSVAVPSLSSSFYGHPVRKPLESVDRKHVSVQICKKDFLRLGGTNIGSNPDLH